MGDRAAAEGSLTSLRHDLEEIDRALVLLVAARLEAAGAAIEHRTQRGEPMVDRAQEARVVARAQKWATEVGISPEVVERVFREIVEAGKARFESSRAGIRAADQSRMTAAPTTRSRLRRRSSVPVPTEAST